MPRSLLCVNNSEEILKAKAKAKAQSHYCRATQHPANPPWLVPGEAPCPGRAASDLLAPGGQEVKVTRLGAALHG